ncbi:MAG: hypothetical protein HRT44_09560, partial [Bdellovibrionales bacterium]|nr:ATP-binding protein [Bdellovibrionales bacterium]NQZ19486.1 hypothetical protein [Bdellovibrionales bacterium]
MDEITKLKNKLKRTEKALERAEHLLETKSHELYHLNQSLEDEVKKRVHDYELARDAAVEASKAKDRFVANMNHELRTPLNGIIGMVNLLKKTELNVEQADYLTTIEKSSEILLSIINDVLEFSKIEAGKTQIELTEFNIARTLENIADIMYYKAYEKNVQINIFIDDDYPQNFISDEKKISQILINLVGNSIKFTPKGDINISLFNDPVGAKIKVQDTGIGIREDKLETIFAPFLQADNSDTRLYGGSGLGLSICKSFAEALGGDITVTSDEGVGTEFIFTVKNHNDKSPKAEVISFSDNNVVIAISNASLEKFVTTKLDQWGCNYKTIISLKDASPELFDKMKYKLIVDEILIQEGWMPPENSELHIFCHTINSKELRTQYTEASVIRFPLHRQELLTILNGQTVKKETS